MKKTSIIKLITAAMAASVLLTGCSDIEDIIDDIDEELEELEEDAEEEIEDEEELAGIIRDVVDNTFK